MRLICPNCGAQYDVADDAIPSGGRDVQCSSCNYTWFQTGAKSGALPGPKMPDPAVQQDAPPARKPVDPSISDILREEAAREQKLRASGTGSPPKTQDDTVPKPAVDADETRRRIAQMTEAEGGVRVAAAPKPAEPVRAATTRTEPDAPRVIIPQPQPEPEPHTDTNPRDMPSMNDINSSLRARSQTAEPQLTSTEQEEVVKRRGFRRGFAFVLLVFAILLAPYVFADQITESFPQTQSAMTAYVTTIDDLRLSLDRAVSSLTDSVTNSAAEDQPAQN
ncbi:MULTISPECIES: zinc-ribbon domain-containing protein [unclassified Yoonia]|uniref:zinc-ribbon domain-containing protein n=1 Tax=unclassified Yoonia TaxID=2629118 RepID=UPI002AFEAD8C|nr:MULTISPECIES: zinc-ribbon domain-containing protein [unclassified Yoonia]